MSSKVERDRANLYFVEDNAIDPSWLDDYCAFLPKAKHIWDNHVDELATTNYGVESSTIRAIRSGARGSVQGPLAIYDRWAQTEHSGLKVPDWQPGGPAQRSALAQARFHETTAYWANLSAAAMNAHQSHWRDMTIEDFEDQHMNLIANIKVSWDNEVSAIHGQGTDAAKRFSLSFAHTRKLVALFVRWSRVKVKPGSAMETKIRSYAHVPLDKKSLAVLAKTFRGRVPIERISTHKYAMGDVKTPEDYETYQEMARLVARMAIKKGAPAYSSPILFDVFAWHHPRAQAAYAKPVR